MRYQCRSCELVIKEVVAFCPRCGRPTAHASPDEVREFELTQWRQHQSGETRTAAGAPAREVTPHAKVAVVHTRRPTSKTSKPKRDRSRGRKQPSALQAVLKQREPEPTPVDPDDPFHYTACTSCSKTDWLLRTGRNEDETWRYWCVRCSRSLKTDALIPHGRKPFLAAGGVLTTLAVIAAVL